MTPMVGVGISSVLGAVLFWVAGYAMARAKKKKDTAFGSEQALDPQIAALKVELKRQTAELEQRSQEVRQAREETARASQGGQDVEKLQRELAAARQKAAQVEQAQEQVRVLRSEVEQARALQGEVEQARALKGELEQVRRARHQASSELRRVVKERDAALRQVEDGSEEAIEEATQVSKGPEQIVRLEHELVEKTTALQQANSRCGKLAAQVRDLEGNLERAQKDNDNLKRMSSKPAKNVATDGVDQLKEELRTALRDRERALAENHAANARLELLTRQHDDAVASLEKEAKRVAALEQQAAKVSSLEKRAVQAKEGAAQQAQAQQAKEVDQRRRLEQEVQQLRQQHEASLKAAKERQEKLESQVAEARRREVELTREVEQLGQAGTELEDHRARLAAADNKLSQLSALEEERFTLLQKIEELERGQARVEDVEELRKERQDLRLQLEVLQKKGQVLDEVQDERAHMAKEHEQLHRQVADLTARLETFESVADEKTDMAMRLDVLTRKASEVDRLLEENAQLKELGQEMDGLKAQLEKQRVENASLRSRAVAAEPLPVPTVDEQGEGVSDALNRLLAQLCSKDSARSAAVADEAGLLVSGIGEHAEALAALSAIFTQAASRVETVLPMAEIHQVAVIDENAITLTTQPLKTELGVLVVATLSVGAGPDRAMLERAVQAATTPSQ